MGATRKEKNNKRKDSERERAALTYGVVVSVGRCRRAGSILTRRLSTWGQQRRMGSRVLSGFGYGFIWRWGNQRLGEMIWFYFFISLLLRPICRWFLRKSYRRQHAAKIVGVLKHYQWQFPRSKIRLYFLLPTRISVGNFDHFMRTHSSFFSFFEIIKSPTILI